MFLEASIDIVKYNCTPFKNHFLYKYLFKQPAITQFWCTCPKLQIVMPWHLLFDQIHWSLSLSLIVLRYSCWNNSSDVKVRNKYCRPRLTDYLKNVSLKRYLIYEAKRETIDHLSSVSNAVLESYSLFQQPRLIVPVCLPVFNEVRDNLGV